MGGSKPGNDLKLVHLRLSRVGLAAFLAPAVRADDADTGSVTAETPLGEVDGIIVPSCDRILFHRSGLRRRSETFAAPGAELAANGRLTLADRADLASNISGAMWAFHGSL
jgi:hypothetical protein